MTSRTGESPQLAALRSLLGEEKPPSPSRAWRAIRELVVMDYGIGTTAATELAADFAVIAEPPTDRLLKLWPAVTDRGEFARLLLAPAFAREHRTELDLGRKHTLEGVGHLTTLRRLRISRRKDITVLDGLATLRNLIHLDLDQCPEISDLAPIVGLTELTTLNLGGCRAVIDLAPLKALTGLERLDLSRTGISHLADLTELAALTELNVSRCVRLEDLEGLGDKPALTTLKIEGCARLTSLRGLGTLPGITRLSLTGCDELTDLRGITGLTGLEGLVISGCAGLASLEGVEQLPSLRWVSIVDSPEVRDLSPLSAVPALRKLLLSGQPVTDASSLPRSASLNELTLRYCDILDNLDGLGGLPALSDLWLDGCGGLRTPGTGHDLPSLRRLTLWSSPALEDLGGIADLPALAELSLLRLPDDLDPAGLRGRAPFKTIRTHRDHDPRWQAAISQALGKKVRMVNGWLEVLDEPLDA
ncbi:leucine-rich repeat domain-containing protein [Nonomuraea sp. CA-143628]|uniref:leucine-rich repeat domain-containing protein n=1 Tax=Nonomuraea sp. CA-143628 TaxID=3239997 RepID=UPI003D926335